MGNTMTTSVARQLGSLFEAGSAAGLSDRQLLERFADGRDPLAAEAAFAALVARHGPMVLSLCRQLLGDHQHAEDAFQAAFLVLARRARSVRDPDRLGPWLHGVALRTARKARGRIALIRRTEEHRARAHPEECTAAPAEAERSAIDREHAEALHAEVDRLPASARLPVLLCYFEGLSLAEAAARLRCPAGTVHSRLARARERLRRGLLRRGVVLSTSALAATMAPRGARASVTPALCEATARAAIVFAARRAAGGTAAAAIAGEVLRTMLIPRSRLVAASALALAVLAAGVGARGRSQAIREDPAKEPAKPATPSAPPAAGRPRAEARPDPAAPGRMTVSGRVLDPDGRPLKDAPVEIIALKRTPETGTGGEIADDLVLLGRTRSDADGRFRCDLPRPSPRSVRDLMAMAAVPGHGLRMAYLDAEADRPEAEITLRPEQPVRLRLVDLNGAPAKGVELGVVGYWRPDASESAEEDAWFGGVPSKDFTTWPAPVKTDDQGRATLPGIGRGLIVRLGVRDARFARQDLDASPARTGPSGEITFALQPARIIEGRVLAADTGRPIPNALVTAATESRSEFHNTFATARTRTDDQGRFVINPHAGDSYTLRAFPADGQPYLIAQDELKWTKGSIRATHDIKVPRGVVIRGKVTERGTGRPLPASSVHYIPAHDDEHVVSGDESIVASAADGSFRIAVRPGKGHLLVFGPTDEFVAEVIGSNRLYENGPGGQRVRAHAILPYEAKPDGPPPEILAALRPGATIRGRVEGPDGRPIDKALLIATIPAEDIDGTFDDAPSRPIRNGRFELRGVDPAGSTRIWIIDFPGYASGATVDVSGQQAGREFTVRLQPCGTAKGRYVGPDGKPVARHRTYVEFVATPGPPPYSMRRQDISQLSADSTLLGTFDSYYTDGPPADTEGRVVLPHLIPGALYRINDESTINDEARGQQVRRDFTVKPGETLDLGDILIEKP